MTRGKAQQLRALIEQLVITLDDETALTGIELFRAWAEDKAYSVGERVRHGETLYKCVQAHTSQSGWEPNVTPALWTVVSVEEFPEWVQPTGAHDAYELGAKVTHNGKRWASTIAANVYEPGVYGWEEIVKGE